jgi:hypothetical protein
MRWNDADALDPEADEEENNEEEIEFTAKDDASAVEGGE